MSDIKQLFNTMK